ncbi:MAG: hypothetical protein NT076_04480 [Candidatus Pacearchaeota archaeon]|nr:hypothetical protein [Candidatus Pacearchaeota archaeon]
MNYGYRVKGRILKEGESAREPGEDYVERGVLTSGSSLTNYELIYPAGTSNEDMIVLGDAARSLFKRGATKLEIKCRKK